jgi:hypothetical protein
LFCRGKLPLCKYCKCWGIAFSETSRFSNASFPIFFGSTAPPAPSESPPGNTKRNDHPRLPPLRFSVHPRVTFWSIPQKGDFTPLHVLVGPFINRPAPAHLHISDPPQKKNDWLQEKEKKKRKREKSETSRIHKTPPIYSRAIHIICT